MNTAEILDSAQQRKLEEGRRDLKVRIESLLRKEKYRGRFEHALVEVYNQVDVTDPWKIAGKVSSLVRKVNKELRDKFMREHVKMMIVTDSIFFVFLLLAQLLNYCGLMTLEQTTLSGMYNVQFVCSLLIVDGLLHLFSGRGIGLTQIIIELSGDRVTDY